MTMTLNLHLSIDLAINLLAAGTYFGAASLLWKNMDLMHAASKIKSLGFQLWLLAMLLHGGGLLPLLSSGAGLDLAFFKSASLIALIISLLLFINCLRQSLEVLAFFILPVTALLVLLAYFSTTQHIISGAVHMGVQAHIILSLLAYSLLSFGALQSLVLAWQDRQLRRNPSHFFMNRLPSLEAMESFLLTLITSGFILLTLGIFAGFHIYLSLIHI